MRIIKNNYVPEWPKETTCQKCNSILEYEEQDMKSEKQIMSDQRQGDWEVLYIYLECPCCKSEIKV